MEPKLLPLHGWRPLVEEAAAALTTPQHKGLLRSLLTTAHNRHIGLTPGLASGLTLLLLPGTTAYAPPWDAVMKRLTGTITEISGMDERTQSVRNVRMTLSASIRFSVYELAFPLVFAAARRIGCNVLFSEDVDLRESLSPEEYDTYACKLEDAICKLATDAPDGGQNLPSSFWKARALTLISLTREQRDPDANPHPTASLPDARLLLDLQPETSYKHDDLRKRLQLSPRRVLTDPRQHDAGASSVKVTRGIEDLHRMLKSELIYPDLILADRLMNTGYWSIQPPPKPIQLRQLLLVAVCPWEISQSRMAPFVKACWLHFLTRFCHILQHNDLVRSEIRWIEGDKFTQARSLAFILSDMSTISAHYPNPTEPRYLYEFLNACGWFPAYIDRHAHYQPVSGWSTPFNKYQSSMLMAWAVKAWNCQQEFTRWSAPVKRRNVLPTKTGDNARTDAFAPTKLQVDQYIHVHLVVFLPSWLRPSVANVESAQEAEWESAPRWRSRFKGVKSLTMLYVPEDGFGKPGWELLGDPLHDRSLLSTVHELDTGKLSGILIDEWFDHIARGIERA
jgi:hypothetical protein